MHESRLISSAISLLEAETKKRGAGGILRVFLKLGPGPHNLEPERVKEVFALLARGTLAEGAEVIAESSGSEQTEELVIEKFQVRHYLPRGI